METINDIVREMRSKTAKSKDEAWYDKERWVELCDRIEAATKAYNKEITELLREVIAGVCLHCDMQSACQEGEDGKSTNCNAVAKAKHFIEQHEEPELNNNECPF